MKSTLRPMAIGLFVLFAQTATASDNVDFCTPVCDSKGCKPTRDCLEATIENRSWTVVEKVKIEQLTNNGCAGEEKWHTANLKKGQGFTGYFARGCSYKISYKTTEACGGDKDVTLKPEHLEKYVVENDQLVTTKSVLVAQLWDTCDSLNGRRIYRTNRLHNQ